MVEQASLLVPSPVSAQTQGIQLLLRPPASPTGSGPGPCREVCGHCPARKEQGTGTKVMFVIVKDKKEPPAPRSLGKSNYKPCL